MKKYLVLLLVCVLFVSQVLAPGILEATISPQIAEFLCERGIAYYNQDNSAEALIEFKKALLADPKSVIAHEYIAKIENQRVVVLERGAPMLQSERAIILSRESSQSSRPLSGTSFFSSKSLSRQLKKDISDIQKAVLFEKKIEKSPPRRSARKSRLISALTQADLGGMPVPLEQPQETVIELKDLEKKGDFYEIATASDDTLIMRSRKIDRFIVTDPVYLSASRTGEGEVLVQPKSVGTGYMYLWDERGRRNIKFLIGPKRIGEYLAHRVERQRQEALLPESFKLGYSIENDSFYTGRRLYNVERVNNPYVYTSSAKGETPFGKFNAAIQAKRTNLQQYFIPNIRMSLTDAHYDQFKDIDIYAFDFTPTLNSFNFPAADLRGVSVEAPMFHHAFNYTTFWGSLPEGDFATLSAESGLSKRKKAWLEGAGLNYKPLDNLNLKSFFAHAYGPERTEPVLTNNTMGTGFDYAAGPFSLGSEMATDMTHKSYAGRTGVRFSKWDLGLSMTDNNKNYESLFGGASSSGNMGGVLNLNLRPTQSLNISNFFAGDLDRVFFNPERPTRPNYTGSTRVNWYADAHTEYELGYSMDDRIGSNTPSITETKEILVRRQLFAVRKINTFLSYQNRRAKYYTSPAQDFNNNRVLAGLSVRIISELYYYYNREYNILQNNFTGERATPYAQETGLNYYRRIFNSPFYLRSRLSYRSEYNTESTLSYLSGEDRLGGEGELTYRPTANNESFLRLRVDNIWAAKEGVTKHFDLDVSWGVRLLWDTGFRWLPRGNFQGYVYSDVNGDGIRQNRESGLEGVVIKSSQGQSAKTNADGYYRIKGVTGKSATLELDTKTLPKGYAPTTRVAKDVDVVHATTKRVDFGAATRTEVSGIVFLDKNANGRYDPGVDEALKGVVIIFDGKERAVSSLLGEYLFRRMTGGEHTIALDLKSIPIKYIPKVPIKKTVKISEAESLSYNIPLELQASSK